MRQEGKQGAFVPLYRHKSLLLHIKDTHDNKKEAGTLVYQMNRYIIILCVLITGMASCFTSCIDDSFSTSPSDILAFSTDTINFDTIFTAEGTSTRTLKVYNRNNKSLNISSINLAKGSSSGFIVNVDGVSGTSFDNIEIRAQDSLYIFVIANVAETGNAEPVTNRDSLIFMTNGVRQEVKLLARTQDAKRLYGIVIDSDTTLTAEKPFIIYDSLVVAPQATLTLAEGTTLYFHDKAYIGVYGSLQANGSPGQRVTLRGDRLDKMFDNLPYNNLAGQWGGVHFHTGSRDNHLTHVMLRGTTWGIVCDSTDTDSPTLTIHNSIIHNAIENLLTSYCNNIVITNSELSDAGQSVVNLIGGTAELTHCTIVNYYFYDVITGAIINIPPVEEAIEKGMSVSFINCLIAGNTTPLSQGDLTGSNIFLNSCMLTVSGSNDDNFITCVWEGEPHFLLTDRENYLYDYRIGSEESSAIGCGNLAYTLPPLDCDMYGNSRAGRADAGAYQYIPTEDSE